MTEPTPETPVEDRIEQDPAADEAGSGPSRDPEASEADAVEQATAATPGEGGARLPTDVSSAEAAEADLAEQSVEVGDDDDERR